MSSVPSQRHEFKHGGRVIYAWEQDLSEVQIDIPLPPGATKKDLVVTITGDQLTVGLKGVPPYLDVGAPFPSKVKASESYWTADDGTLSLQISKAIKAEFWPSALQGHELGAGSQIAEREALMRHRFQEEHPGFDFSGAKFEGEVPEARTFMGGLNRP